MAKGSDSEDLSLIPGFGFLRQSLVNKAEGIFEAMTFLWSYVENRQVYSTLLTYIVLLNVFDISIDTLLMLVFRIFWIHGIKMNGTS